MKKLIFYLILNFFNLIMLTDLLNAQINEIWNNKDGVGYTIFIGSANMDNDPQEEIVYGKYDSPGVKSILILDGLTGKIDWDSGSQYKYIVIANFNYQGENNFALSSPFLDLGNGLKALTFYAYDGNSSSIRVVGQKGGTGEIAKLKTIPTDVNKLSQNYPNPFNPDTQISYTVQKAGLVEIKIFNSLGQLVRTVVDEYKPMGEYEVVWDGKDESGVTASSGAYFYQLKIGDFVSSKKMLLLK